MTNDGAGAPPSSASGSGLDIAAERWRSAADGSERSAAELVLAAELRARHRQDLTAPTASVLDRWIDTSVSGLGAFPDGFTAVHRGDLDGFLVRGLLSPAEAQKFNEALVRADVLHDNVGGRLVGTSLLGLDDLEPYFEAVEETRRLLRDLFAFDFEGRLRGVLEALGGGRPADLPTDDSGRTYLPATVRVLDGQGGGYRSHTGNEFVEAYRSYDHLRTIARTTDALSYFLLTQVPEGGGELVIYDLTWTETPAELRGQLMSIGRDAALEHCAKAYVDPQPGDLILFNGGRIWHKVADIEGPTPRITVGGFATLSADEASVYYWN